MRKGAVDYVQKPFRNEAIVRRLETIGAIADLAEENRGLREQLDAREPGAFDGIVGSSDAMKKVFERVRTVAATEATVEIEGESGTGKERIAQAVHSLSQRKDGPFIALGCGALPENLLEAELFGHEKGAFTDAKAARKGGSSSRTGAPCSWTTSTTCPCPSRSSSCASCRSAPSNGSAARRREPRTSGSSWRPRCRSADS